MHLELVRSELAHKVEEWAQIVRVDELHIRDLSLFQSNQITQLFYCLGFGPQQPIENQVVLGLLLSLLVAEAALV